MDMENLLKKIIDKKITYDEVNTKEFKEFLEKKIKELYTHKSRTSFIKLEKILGVYNELKKLKHVGVLQDDSIREDMRKKGFKPILNGSYYINKEAKVYRVKNNTILEVKTSNSVNNGLKINYYDSEGKQHTKQLHLLVYEAFKGVTDSDIIFIDGNKKNCSIDNLISLEDLVKFYKEKNNNGGIEKNE